MTPLPEQTSMESTQMKPWWAKGAQAWIWLTVVIDVVASLGLLCVAFLSLSGGVDAAFGSVFPLTWACVFLILSWATIKRQRGAVRWEWVSGIGAILFGVIWCLAISQVAVGWGALIVLPMYLAIPVFLVIRITRIIAIGTLRRRGFWEPASDSPTGRTLSGKAIAALLAVCAFLDLLLAGIIG